MSASKLAGRTPRTGSEGPISENSSDCVAATDQPGPIDADAASTCDNCNFTTLNGWELQLVPAKELDFEPRGWNALLCDDCREKHRVDGGEA